jgi:hypothetical protein
VHTILCVREVYPSEAFVRRKKFGTPVFQSRHPGLNAYVAGAVKAVREELLRVRRVSEAACGCAECDAAGHGGQGRRRDQGPAGHAARALRLLHPEDD